MQEFTLLCWNIAYGEHLSKISDAICAINPDVVVLQESGGGPTGKDGLAVAEAIAKASDMYTVFTPEFLELRKESKGKKVYTGQALLSKHSLKVLEPLYFFAQATDWEKPELKHPRTWFNFRGYTQPRQGKRVAQLIELTIHGYAVIVANVHLESSESRQHIRDNQTSELIQRLTRFEKKNVIVAGDLNSGPKSPTIQMLKKIFRDVFGKNTDIKRRYTTSNRGHLVTIDWVFAKGPELYILSARTLHEYKSSDHFPILVTFALAP